MTNLSVFAFEGHQVRFVGTAENPEWVAADVCSILGLDTSIAIDLLQKSSSEFQLKVVQGSNQIAA
jgi:prophage antirepressor-like protein